MQSVSMNHNDVHDGYVTSRDGTQIGFRRFGSGPGLVLVQGAMATALQFEDLARALSLSFTVYTPDRRGRGMSPKPYNRGHDIARDVEDIDALLAETGASWVFGMSSGAIITLEAARTLARVTKAFVYEPPFYAFGISHDGIQQLNAEVERGDLPAAFVSALRVTEMVPAPIKFLPQPIARLLAKGVLRFDDRNHGSYVRLRDLIPGVRYDFNVVGGMDGKMDMFTSIDKPMLLLSGTKSAAFLRQSIRTLDGILPQSEHIEFSGLNHASSWNARGGGRPEVVAAALRTFFA